MRTILLICVLLPCAVRCSPVTPESSDRIAYLLSHPRFEGRLSGSSAMKETAKQLEGIYRRNGFYPAFRGSFLQEFLFPDDYRSAGEAWILRDSRRIAAKSFPFSDVQRASGEMVFAGYCLKKDLENSDFRNKAVVCRRFGPGIRDPSRADPGMTFSAKYDHLKNLGAAAVIFTNLYPRHPVHFNPDSYGKSGSGPPAVIADEKLFLDFFPEFRYAFSLCESAGICVPQNSQNKVWVHSGSPATVLKGRNTGAWLRDPSGFRPSAVYIVMAHADHLGKGSFASLDHSTVPLIHPGADDNASGSAAVLRAAWKLRQYDLEKSLPDSVNVLFLHTDAEERGLYGSAEFIKKYIHGRNLYLQDNTVAPVAALINLDMVGNLNPQKGLIIQGEDSGNALWSRSVREAVKKSFSGSGYRIRYIRGGAGPSDHELFYKEGIPVAFFHTGSHGRYHTSLDTFQFLNTDGIQKIGDVAAEVIRISSLSGSLPEFRKAPAEADLKDFD